ncbi:hypothetical protein F5Y16DRAFT_354444 [Xylariaceae sp. FL0255]|nr:hypothetical protein F5Y16DRAFT_354444 [Xylariaceae sp. FL0255]
MSTSSVLYRPTADDISEHAFKIILWVLTSLCTVMFALRLMIRFSVFRYFLAEDYVIALAWAILIALAVLLQTFLGDIYLIQHVENGTLVPSADFPNTLVRGLRFDGTAIILDTIGIWSIKFSFLLFFRRFGREIQSYMTLWFIALVVVAAAGGAHIGLVPYECTFTTFTQLIGRCSLPSKISQISARYIASVVVDVISDLVVIFFPVVIVWRTKLNLRQKVVLTCIFLCVAFTIAVTVVRGSIFGGLYKSVGSVNEKVINTSWILFWFMIEYTVSFGVACIVSFRSLWARREHKSRDKRIELEKQKRIIIAQRNSMQLGAMRRGILRLHDSLMSTFADLEGAELNTSRSGFIQFEPPSGNMKVDFSKWNSADHTTNVEVESDANLGSGSSSTDHH